MVVLSGDSKTNNVDQKLKSTKKEGEGQKVTDLFLHKTNKFLMYNIKTEVTNKREITKQYK